MKTSIDMIRAKLKNPPTVNIIEEDESKLTHRIQYKELKVFLAQTSVDVLTESMNTIQRIESFSSFTFTTTNTTSCRIQY
ncbi:MAG: hypothetical protein QXY55_06160, partial [Candidatus Korarchaeota archaeon]